jgi:hypothetical protein
LLRPKYLASSNNSPVDFPAGSSLTDGETDLVLMACYNTWTGSVFNTGVNYARLVMKYEITHEHVAID